MKVQERAATYGTKSLTNGEIIKLLIGADIKLEKSFNEIRDKIDLLEITDLQKLKLEALFNFADRTNRAKVERIKISSPDDAAMLMMEEMRYLQKEYFKILLLDTKNNVKKISEISVGSLNSSIVHPREVFKEAVINSCSSIILVHNHPSGEAQPSHEDIVLTNRLDECGKLMGIKVLDHVVIGDGVYFSFKEEGLI
jgi:DNA repair protein RadC